MDTAGKFSSVYKLRQGKRLPQQEAVCGQTKSSPFCLVTKSRPTLCHPLDCGLPGCSVHATSQARIMEWVAISFSRGCFQTRDRAHISCGFFTSKPPEKPKNPPHTLGKDGAGSSYTGSRGTPRTTLGFYSEAPCLVNGDLSLRLILFSILPCP